MSQSRRTPVGLGTPDTAAITDFTQAIMPGFYRWTGGAAAGAPSDQAFLNSCIVDRGGGGSTGFLSWRNTSGAVNQRVYVGSRTTETGPVAWTEVLTSAIIATSIAAAPRFAGQLAVVDGIGFMANGTESPANWRRVTAFAPSAHDFVPVIEMDGVPIETTGGVYSAPRTGTAHFVSEGLLAITFNVLLSAKGTGSGALRLRWPTVATDGKALPAAQARLAAPSFVIGLAAADIDQVTAVSVTGGRVFELFKRVGNVTTALRAEDIGNAFQVNAPVWIPLA